MDRSTSALGGFLNKLAAHLVLDQPVHDVLPVPGLRESVEQAKRDWLCATAYFEQVSAPELVDYAVYQVKAAERRYMYLLQQARDHPAAMFDSRS